MRNTFVSRSLKPSLRYKLFAPSRVGRDVKSMERSPKCFAASTAVRIRSRPTPCLRTASEVTTSSIRARSPVMVICSTRVKVPTNSPSLLATNTIVLGFAKILIRSSGKSGGADRESCRKSILNAGTSASVSVVASSLSTVVSTASAPILVWPEYARRR
jgi:hypothetical protein